MKAVSIQTGLGLGVIAAKDGCARSAGRMETPACCALLCVVSVLLRLGLYVAKNMGTLKGYLSTLYEFTKALYKCIKTLYTCNIKGVLIE
jgi:hypothetical protein